jgi:hypothetical protein
VLSIERCDEAKGWIDFTIDQHRDLDSATFDLRRILSLQCH